MEHIDFAFDEYGFVGHMAVPLKKTKKAVLVIMGGEKSFLPGIKIAERFADYGMIGLSVSLFGAKGLPKSPDRIPLEMFERAIDYLRKEQNIQHISVYGMSMGTIFAVLTAAKIGGIENLILVSPTHVPFMGARDKKSVTGHSVVTYHGEEIPYVQADFSKYNSGKYYVDEKTGKMVTGMYLSYQEAYADKEREKQAVLPIEAANARILILAGSGDEQWPADYSAHFLQDRLTQVHYARQHEMLIFPNACHLIGLWPNRQRNKLLHFFGPLVLGCFFKSFQKYPRETIRASRQSERMIMKWLGAKVDYE